MDRIAKPLVSFNTVVLWDGRLAVNEDQPIYKFPTPRNMTETRSQVPLCKGNIESNGERFRTGRPGLAHNVLSR